MTFKFNNLRSVYITGTAKQEVTYFTLTSQSPLANIQFIGISTMPSAHVSDDPGIVVVS